MGRSAAIAKTKILMLRGAKRVEHRALSKIAEAAADHRDINTTNKYSKGRESEEIKEETSSNWVPHPKSGIYFPKGHEWVMNDVPDGAASLAQTFWLRNVDGVEKPDTDHDA